MRMVTAATEPGEILARIGTMIQQARIAAGISQAELAASLGMSRPSVSHMEAGRRSFSFLTLVAIARTLEMDLNALGALADLLPPRAPAPHHVTRSTQVVAWCLTCDKAVGSASTDFGARQAAAEHVNQMLSRDLADRIDGAAQ
jgi:transcriptional regulator with XRE-family HTH domain